MGTGGLFLRKLRARISDEPTGFVWVEKGKIAASGFPASRNQVEWLSSHGIDSILTLTPDPLPREWVDGLPLTLGHVPMDDHREPDAISLAKGAAFVQDQVKGGKIVLVHCLAGEGRTGCVLTAYLIKYGRMGAAQALEVLREVKPAFVEWSQEKALFEFEAANR